MAFLPFAFARAAIVNALNAAENDQIDVIPDRFNNSIRWNAGHVVVVADNILKHAKDYSHSLPSHYATFFDMGTSPAGWTDSPPTAEEISEMSRQQLEAAAKLEANDHNGQSLIEVFDLRGTKFSTIPDLLGFLAYHEGMHYDTIKILLRITEK